MKRKLAISFILGLTIGSAAIEYSWKSDARFLETKKEVAEKSYSQGCEAGAFFTLGTLFNQPEFQNLCTPEDIKEHVESVE